jgi:acetolactate synthase-1/2/3 large subunit
MKIKISDYIRDFFERKKFKHVFGVTGGGAMHLNDSFGSSNKMKFVFFHHEQSASMAADSYFRINNQPCLLHTTSGPGATNAITGVTGAWIDSIPMFIISGQVPTQDMINNTNTRQIGVQEINIIDLVKPITKYAKVITNPLDIEIILHEAYNKMLLGKYGPVWVDIPLDIQSKIIDVSQIKKFKKKKIRKRNRDIKEKKILSLINASKKPLVIVGNGVHLAKAKIDFTKFIHKFKIPIISSWNATDLINYNSDLYVGSMGIFGDRAANMSVHNSDLLIVIGSRLSIPQTGYKRDEFSPKSKKILINISKSELNSNKLKNTVMKINCDVKFFLKNLNQFIKNKKISQFNEWNLLTKKWKKQYPVFDIKNYKKKTKINSFYFIDTLSKNLKGNEIIVTDMGTSFTCTMQTFKIHDKLKQRLFTSSGLASMGFGLPGAIGAYFADKKKPLICISGEGGLMFNIQELQTVKNYKIPLKLFILENQGYLTMKLMQKKNFKKLIGSDPHSGLTFPSFKNLAKSFDFDYIKLNHKFLNKNLRKIISSKLPTIIEVNMPPFQELNPRLQNKLNKDGSFETTQFDDLYPYLPSKILEFERNLAKNIK